MQEGKIQELLVMDKTSTETFGQRTSASPSWIEGERRTRAMSRRTRVFCAQRATVLADSVAAPLLCPFVLDSNVHPHRSFRPLWPAWIASRTTSSYNTARNQGEAPEFLMMFVGTVTSDAGAPSRKAAIAQRLDALRCGELRVMKNRPKKVAAVCVV
jgi:hypothetical protein